MELFVTKSACAECGHKALVPVICDQCNVNEWYGSQISGFESPEGLIIAYKCKGCGDEGPILSLSQINGKLMDQRVYEVKRD